MIGCLIVLYSLMHALSIRTTVVSECLQGCCVQVCYLHSLKESGNRRKTARPGARTHDLCSITELQPCKPLIPVSILCSNRRRYGHERAAMMRPLRTRALRLELCSGMLIGQLHSMYTKLESEVDGGNSYLSVRCQ